MPPAYITNIKIINKKRFKKLELSLVPRNQLFILKHRDDIVDDGRKANLTFHGLRHTYAAVKYHVLTENGANPLDAHFTVSRLLGHERADVTNIYLASVKKKEARDGE